MKFAWTKAQQKIIQEKADQNLLISAAAGSGKTAVLTERIKQRMIQGQLDPAHLLVMTFTDQAAQNMRRKIEESFQETIKNTVDAEERRNLQGQLLGLAQAQISTIHAFCKQVVQDFSAELLDEGGHVILPADFAVIDPEEKTLLLEEAVDRVLEVFYKEIVELKKTPERGQEIVAQNLPSFEEEIRAFSLTGENLTAAAWLEDFLYVLDFFSNNKDDENLKQALTSSLERLRSMSHYKTWVQGELKKLQLESLKFSGSQTEKELLERVASIFTEALETFRKLENQPFFEEFKTMTTATAKEFFTAFENQKHILEDVQAVMQEGAETRWDDIYRLAKTLPEYKIITKSRKNSQPERDEFIDLYREKIVTALYYLNGAGKPAQGFVKPVPFFTVSTAAMEKDLQKIYPPLCRFFELVLLVDQCYRQLKLARNSVDFNDFEQDAMTLLEKPEIAAYYQEHFSEIYIDEYQDTNNIQESIIACFSQHNVFMVGDMKQSIYRFRYANPELFREKAKLYGQADCQKGKLLLLNQNFRSSKLILDWINQVFENFLSEATGEIDYDEQQRLIPGEIEETAKFPPVQFLLFAQAETKAVKDEVFLKPYAKYTKKDMEAVAVAAQILKLKEEQSELKFQDIAILAITNSDCQNYQRILKKEGIPVASVTEEDFMDAPDLRLLGDVICVLDNVRQDIPLAGVLSSGFFEVLFSGEELAAIRKWSQQQTESAILFFHEACFLYEEKGPESELKEKLHKFFQVLNFYREQANYLKTHELLRLLLLSNAYFEKLTLQTLGSERIKKINGFLNWLERVEQLETRGLHQIVTLIQLYKEKNSDPLEDQTTEEDVVQILTIHKSKGLEFPVVFLVNLDKAMLSRREQQEMIKISERDGISCYGFDAEKNAVFQTAKAYLDREKNNYRDQAEKYRLLYVAMTRAEKMLFLVGEIPSTVTVFEKQISYRTEGAKGVLPTTIVHQAKSYLELLLLPLIHNETDLEKFVSELGDEEARIFEQQGKRIILCNLEALKKRDQQVGLTTAQEKAGKGERDSLTLLSFLMSLTMAQRKKLLQHQDFQELTKLLYSDQVQEAKEKYPAKISVSGLKRRLEQINQATALEEEGESIPQIPEIQAELQEPKFKIKSLEVAAEAVPETHVEIIKNQNNAAEVGTILHTVFQFLELAQLRKSLEQHCFTREYQDNLTKMVERRQIFPEEVKIAQDYELQIKDFVASDLVTAIIAADAEQRSYREIPFTLALAPAELQDLTADPLRMLEDITLVQGMIDLWFFEKEEAILVDYKSDRITGSKAEIAQILSTRYRMQLNFYARAIEQSTGKKVKRKLIWLIQSGSLVEIQ